MPQLEQEYIKTGKVKYVVRDFPLASIHNNAFKAAEAAHCAGAQGKYWEMHTRLFANQRALGLGDLPAHAQALRLDMSGFQQCLESGRYAGAIRKVMADGQQAGVTGAQPYAAFQAAINSLLSAQQ